MPDAETALQAVRDDVVEGLGSWLREADDVDDAGFAVLEPFLTDQLMSSPDGSTVAVPWSWVGRHDADAMGYVPTGRVVEVRGVTIVRDGTDGELRFSRFVDWAGAMGDLGVAFSTRAVHDDEPPQRVLGRGGRSPLHRVIGEEVRRPER